VRKVFALLFIVPIFFSCAKTQVKTEVSQVKQEKTPLKITPGKVAKPIYVPPEVVRVLVMPYEDSRGVLHQGEFLYFTLKPGYWTIASGGSKVEVKKFVSIVRTQRELDQSGQAVLPEFIAPVKFSGSKQVISKKRTNLKRTQNSKELNRIRAYLKK